MNTATTLFDPGAIVATPGFVEKVNRSYALASLQQHLAGNWGVVSADDWQANNDALQSGARLLSAYPLPNESDSFWIITDAADDSGKRSVTTFLLKEEY